MKALSQVIDPHYVQISRQECALIIGRSASEFDRLRKNDPRCPTGVKIGDDKMSKVVFRLSEIYAYSEQLLEDGAKRAAKEAARKAAASSPSDK